MRLVLVLAVLAIGCGDAFQGPCGNGRLDPYEQCDDGNILSGDSCSTNCLREPRCADGFIDSPMENCDDGNTLPGDNCDENCRAETVCGDLDIEPGEMCEDGNTDPSDGCSPECTIEYKVTTNVGWRFAQAESAGNNLGCPAGFDTVEVSTQALRDDDSEVHAPKVERFTCGDGSHEITRYRGRYRVVMRVLDAGGATYATSVARTLEVNHAVQPMTEVFIVDGGYARIGWRLIDPPSQSAESCAHDGVFDIGISITSPTFALSAFAICANGSTITPPLPAGQYTVRIVPLDEVGEERGNAAVVEMAIGAPNGVADVGVVDLSIVP
jgi:cysteine-rich repeat protein